MFMVFHFMYDNWKHGLISIFERAIFWKTRIEFICQKINRKWIQYKEMIWKPIVLNEYFEYVGLDGTLYKTKPKCITNYPFLNKNTICDVIYNHRFSKENSINKIWTKEQADCYTHNDSYKIYKVVAKNPFFTVKYNDTVEINLQNPERNYLIIGNKINLLFMKYYLQRYNKTTFQENNDNDTNTKHILTIFDTSFHKSDVDLKTHFIEFVETGIGYEIKSL